MSTYRQSTPGYLLGLTPYSIEADLRIYESAVKRIEEGKGDLLSEAWDRTSAAESVAEKSYLAGRFDTCAQWCPRVGDAVQYYLLGGWLQKVAKDNGNVESSRRFKSQPCEAWTQYLSKGLGWSAVGGCWGIVDSLCDFLTPQIEYDTEAGKVGREYYFTLADWLRNGDLSRIEEVKRLRGAGSKSFHLLCDILTAIVIAREAELSRAFTIYVKHFLKHRRHERHFPLDATFLWNYARKRGVNCGLPDDTAVYLFELPPE